jgi:signal transduction histidine kinase/CheY-like chemotaxis protein/HAMP domain-containing protein
MSETQNAELKKKPKTLIESIFFFTLIAGSILGLIFTFLSVQHTLAALDKEAQQRTRLLQEFHQNALDKSSATLRLRITRQADSMAKGLGLYLWNIQQAQQPATFQQKLSGCSRILATLLADPAIKAITIALPGYSPQTLAGGKSGTIRTLQDEIFQHEETVPFNREIIYQGSPFGQIVIFADENRLRGYDQSTDTELQQLQSELDQLHMQTDKNLFFYKAMLSVGFIATFVLITAFQFLFRMKEPFNKLQTFARNLKSGNLDTPLTLLSEDEFGQISSSLDSLRGTVKNKLAEVEKLEQDLSQQGMRLKAITGVLPDTLLVLDWDGYILENFGPEGYLYTRSFGDISGATLHDRLPKETADLFLSTLRQAILTEKPKILVYKLEVISGLRWFESRILPLPATEGDAAQVVWLARDITDAKLSQELQKEKDKAEMASRIKSEFIAAMSHEIRTPLNAVLGMLELVQETEITDLQKQYLSIADSAGKDLLALIQDILDISKVEAGQLVLESIPVNIRQVLQDSTSMFQDKCREKGLVLDASIDRSVPAVLAGDPVRIKQIITNLLSNAVKFTDNGGIALHASATEAQQDPGLFYLRIAVTDTGIGIPTAKHEAIFNRFTQVDSSTTRQYGGTGLGLNITKKLTELMGGVLSLQSTEGQGSTFTLRIPLRVEEQKGEQLTVPEKPQQEAIHFQNELPEIPEGSKILLIDDSEYNRFIVRAYLADHPAIIVEEEDGRRGLEKFKKQTFDLILLDLEMPLMDGFETLTAMRHWESRENRPRTTALAITAFASAEEKTKTLRAGFQNTISKPIIKEILIKTIAQSLQKKREMLTTNGEKRQEESPDTFDPIPIQVDPQLKDMAPSFLQFAARCADEIQNELEIARRYDTGKTQHMAAQIVALENIRSQSHRLSGEGEAFGFGPVSRYGHKINIAAKQKDFESIESALEQMTEYLSRVVIS